MSKPSNGVDNDTLLPANWTAGSGNSRLLVVVYFDALSAGEGRIEPSPVVSVQTGAKQEYP